MGEDRGTRVYVGNLGEKVKKEDLEGEFTKYGKLNSVWVAFNPPGFAFVEFENRDEAEKACDILNGTEVLGSKLRVEISKSRPKPRRGPSSSRFGSSSGGSRFGGSSSGSRFGSSGRREGPGNGFRGRDSFRSGGGSSSFSSAGGRGFGSRDTRSFGNSGGSSGYGGSRSFNGGGRSEGSGRGFNGSGGFGRSSAGGGGGGRYRSRSPVGRSRF